MEIGHDLPVEKEPVDFLSAACPLSESWFLWMSVTELPSASFGAEYRASPEVLDLQIETVGVPRPPEISFFLFLFLITGFDLKC